jgi:hypothetical protein
VFAESYERKQDFVLFCEEARVTYWTTLGPGPTLVLIILCMVPLAKGSMKVLCCSSRLKELKTSTFFDLRRIRAILCWQIKIQQLLHFFGVLSGFNKNDAVRPRVVSVGRLECSVEFVVSVE